MSVELPDQCEATVLLLDDRYGGFQCQCEKRVGHDGLHQRVMGATRPTARMSWASPAEGDDE